MPVLQENLQLDSLYLETGKMPVLQENLQLDSLYLETGKMPVLQENLQLDSLYLETGKMPVLQENLQLDSAGLLIQSLTFGEQTITSTATIKDSIIHFDCRNLIPSALIFLDLHRFS